jgi:hypothetical protein
MTWECKGAAAGASRRSRSPAARTRRTQKHEPERGEIGNPSGQLPCHVELIIERRYGSFRHFRAEPHIVQMRLQRVLAPMHRLVFVHADLERVLELTPALHQKIALISIHPHHPPGQRCHVLFHRRAIRRVWREVQIAFQIGFSGPGLLQF